MREENAVRAEAQVQHISLTPPPRVESTLVLQLLEITSFQPFGFKLTPPARPPYGAVLNGEVTALKSKLNKQAADSDDILTHKQREISQKVERVNGLEVRVTHIAASVASQPSPCPPKRLGESIPRRVGRQTNPPPRPPFSSENSFLSETLSAPRKTTQREKAHTQIFLS